MYFNSHIDNYISSHNVTFCGKKQKDEENELVIYDKAATTADSDEEGKQNTATFHCSPNLDAPKPMSFYRCDCFITCSGCLVH